MINKLNVESQLGLQVETKDLNKYEEKRNATSCSLCVIEFTIEKRYQGITVNKTLSIMRC